MEAQSVCPRCQQPIPPDAAQGACPSCLLPLALTASLTHAPAVWTNAEGAESAGPTLPPASAVNLTLQPVPERPVVPGYEIIAELGRGGMGVVYKARHVALNRLVALKMVLAGGHAGADELARFRGEAEAVARLSHPNIVQIFEIGEVAGLPYFALELVEGSSLDRKLAGTPLPPNDAARLLETLARALAAAHAAGLVHRDLKPANVLLAADGTPKITDFGLAKKLDTAGQTASGAVLGTPSYMAPEQAGGRSKEIGPACDVYALGATLYECLTGRPPFRAATALDTILQVVGQEPVPPRQFNARTPVDLETICLKCLQKDPPKRYASALALAEDLRRFLAGEPVAARPVGRVGRAWRWCRRNPVVAALLAAVVGSLLLGTAVAAVLAVRAGRSAAEAIRLADERAELARQEKAQRVGAELQSAQLFQQWGHTLAAQGEVGQGLLWLARGLEQVARTQEGGLGADQLEQANDLEHAIRVDLALCACDLHHLRAVLPHNGRVRAVAFSPDGRLILTGGSGFGVRVWDTRKGTPVGAPLPHPGDVRAVAVGSDGKTVLTAGARGGRGEVRLWDLGSRRPLRPPLRCPSPVLAAALSLDGKTILTGTEDGRVQLWDAATGRPQGEPLTHPKPVLAVAFSRDGRYFVTGCADHARRWHTATRQPAGPLLRGWISAVAFRPDGEAILLGSPEDSARSLDPATGTLLRQMRHPGTVSAAVFTPDGGRVLLAGMDHTARLWDLQAGRPVGAPLRHAEVVAAAAVSPDGKFLATASWDGTARLWQVARGQQLTATAPARDGIYAAVYSTDGKTIAAADFTGTIHFQNAVTGKVRRPPLHRGQTALALVFSPDDRRLLVAETFAGVVRQLDPRTGQEVGPALPSGPVKSLACSSDGKTILTGSTTLYNRWPTVRTEARQWNLETGKASEPPLRHGGDVWAASYSPDGKTILVSGHDPLVRFWDAGTGQPSGKPLVHPAGVGVWAAVWSPDGTRVVTGSNDRMVRVWDTTTRQLTGKALPHPAEVRTLALSPDGKLILTGCRDGFSRLWHFRTRRPVGLPLRQNGVVEKVAFAPDGRRFLTAGRDRTVRQWTVPPAVPGDARQVRAWVETITGLVLDQNEAVQTLTVAQWRQRALRLPQQSPLRSRP